MEFGIARSHSTSDTNRPLKSLDCRETYVACMKVQVRLIRHVISYLKTEESNEQVRDLIVLKLGKMFRPWFEQIVEDGMSVDDFLHIYDSESGVEMLFGALFPSTGVRQFVQDSVLQYYPNGDGATLALCITHDQVESVLNRADSAGSK